MGTAKQALPGASPPPPPPAGLLLYNVAVDVGERSPLDVAQPANAAAVKRLQAVADQYAKTKVPQATADPSCPEFAGINTTNPLTGESAKYIGPWCDNVR